VELKNNIKAAWWKKHVREREDISGIDGAIITHPEVWVASGHVASFIDLMLECTKCSEKMRADHLIEDALKIPADGMKAAEINVLVAKHKLVCPKCKSPFKEVHDFNLMFQTHVGPTEDKAATAYLRPETAQLMFTNFKLVAENARLKLPFGIAQIGRAFRNEISPRNFLFRCREFEQMEIEYFIHPDKASDCPYLGDVEGYEMLVYSAAMQAKEEEPKQMKVEDALKKGIIKTPWHAYWLATEHKWFVDLGVKPEHLRIRQHLDTEKSHYALDTWDLEYKFPFAWKEILGMANRTDFDLQQHIKHSGKDLSLFDEESKKKIVPHVVAEPSFGVDRAFLVFMFDAYSYDKERDNVVLKLHPKLAPVQVGVFPLIKKEPLIELSRSLFQDLKKNFTIFYDASGSIGRRYARQDEAGTPFCVTVDFDSLEDKSVTVRMRDTTEQKRVKIEGLSEFLEHAIEQYK
ncbi:glycine--tRNA ligase, partial [Candidatus Woesearchaeota archaeon CG_4_10_14_0_8_um_filter_47_5]